MDSEDIQRVLEKYIMALDEEAKIRDEEAKIQAIIDEYIVSGQKELDDYRIGEQRDSADKPTNERRARLKKNKIEEALQDRAIAALKSMSISESVTSVAIERIKLIKLN